MKKGEITMKKFEDPKLEVLAFVVEDIVTVSVIEEDDGGFGDLFG